MLQTNNVMRTKAYSSTPPKRHRRRRRNMMLALLLGILPMALFQWQRFSSLQHLTSPFNVTTTLSADVSSILPPPLETKRTRSSIVRGDLEGGTNDVDDDFYYKEYISSLVENGMDIHDDDDRYGDALAAFRLALQRAQRRSQQSSMPLFANLTALEAAAVVAQESKKNTRERMEIGSYSNKNNESSKFLLNLIRVPKAGSSALSITARALVGCAPDGYPCCGGTGKKHRLYPACPRSDLWCPAIRGCLNHDADYSKNTNHQTSAYVFPTITTLRHPVARALSAFFYRPPHRPWSENHSMAFFQHDFIALPQYQNPMTKMLSGYSAYYNHETPPTRRRRRHGSSNTSEKEEDATTTLPIIISVDEAKARLCQLDFFGLAEMPLVSNLLLYESPPFDRLWPNPVAFGLPPKNGYFNNNSPATTVVVSTADVATAAPRHLLLQSDNSSSIRSSNNNTTTTTTTTANIMEITTEPNSLIRYNGARNYKKFKTRDFVQHNGAALVNQYQAMDVQVYDFAVSLFCQRLFSNKKHIMMDLVKEAEDGYKSLARHFQPCRQTLEQQHQQQQQESATRGPLDFCANVLEEKRH
jgi:hypothetical protein